MITDEQLDELERAAQEATLDVDVWAVEGGYTVLALIAALREARAQLDLCQSWIESTDPLIEALRDQRRTPDGYVELYILGRHVDQLVAARSELEHKAAKGEME